MAHRALLQCSSRKQQSREPKHLLVDWSEVLRSINRIFILDNIGGIGEIALDRRYGVAGMPSGNQTEASQSPDSKKLVPGTFLLASYQPSVLNHPNL